MDSQERLVSEAFGAQSPKFDQITTGNPMEVLFREVVRKHVLQYTKTGEHLLELNCGTGLDAVYFTKHGLKVYATDNSEGMLEQLNKKIHEFKLNGQIQFQKCSFNHLDELKTDIKFDHVFSNFGGLNCAPDLGKVVTELGLHLRKDSMVHFVLICPVCIWELASIFKGRFKYAFRRFSKKGVKSKVEGHYFDTYYYSFSEVKKLFGKSYDLVKLTSIGCFLPPTYKEKFPKKMPALFNYLKKIELTLNSLWPFNRVGDLYIVSLRKNN